MHMNGKTWLQLNLARLSSSKFDMLFVSAWLGAITPRHRIIQGVGNTEPTGKILRHRGCTGLSFTRRKGCGHEDRIC